MTNNLKRAMDAELSGLCVTQRQRAEILECALEGRKVKRKVSWAFVLAAALACSAAVALAVTAITETGRLMARTERESGTYGNWPAETRVQIVGELMDEGYISETEMRRQMRDGALAPDIAAQTADEAIAAFTGEAAKDASFLSIMQTAWGPFEMWTREQQAWYSRVMDEAGFDSAGKTVYVESTGQVTEQEAVAIAKREVVRVFGLPKELLDRYRVEVSFQIQKMQSWATRKRGGMCALTHGIRGWMRLRCLS